MKIYLVGGAVRDRLLGLPVKDRDWVVVGARSEDMLKAGYQQVGRDFPVFLHPVTKQEYALARTERKQGSGYTGFVVQASPEVTLEEDLLRRDLTINAIAESDQGELVDPFGGCADIEARLLRHVSPAFAEDPLRVLRVARFAARFAHLGFTVAPATLALMRELSESGELEALIPERIWQEIHKALCTRSPQVFLQVLRDCGALEHLLPEIANLFGVPQPEFFHPEIDTGIHTLLVVEQAAKLTEDPAIRFAAMVHDLGKAVTPKALWPAHKGHEGLGAELIDAMSQRLRIPNEYRELAILTSQHHTRCHRAIQHTAEERFTTLELTDAIRRPRRFAQFLLACEADARGRTGLEERAYPQHAILSHDLNTALQLDVRSVIAGQPSSPELGLIIRQARINSIAEHPFTPDAEPPE